MSAATTAPAAARVTLQPVPDARLRFTGLLRSEWIKLTTLRSTVWAYAILIALQIGMGVLLVLTQTGEMSAAAGSDAAAAAQAAVQVSTLGILFNQLVISVLGVLVITGEYGTGQIRSSLTAVPKRLPVLWAKALVFSVTSFVVGLVAVFASYAVTWPMLQANGVESDLGDVEVWGHLVGAAGYLALIGLVAFFLGALLRHTAGGIAAAVGLLLVVPSVISFISADWASVLADWLPGSVGQTLFFGGGVFEPWQAVLVMLGWIALFAVPAAVLMRRRDA
ncbi:ABC transporter permease [Herbiconiux flava]|uniref:ABC-2 type transport system permease protein n=1 Tax=Herbiconiux flava TaxID=881268 RepID=A0A852SML1_9MICO|nr:ABC transporter permease [Herbiconiux flava]NYD70046.1 ABC-2 type transport system permease protein [Herbiconiux flava]GLK16796.1 ABC transporter permease [Herbiconiux flava]